ncbi:hypothetical protein E4U54_004682 [Claviceps lovelessii]|nr:hypothetical protein E4U54_004682 [Claviceps lovelessii]
MRTGPRTHGRAAAAIRGVSVTLGLASVAMQQLPTATAHVFPYVPTQILMPAACWNEPSCNGADLAYVFSQADNGTVQFSALNYSSTVGGAESQLVRLTMQLPFLQDEPATTAFGAARASDGSVMVYSGPCDGATGSASASASVWVYTISTADGESVGAWSRRTMTTKTSAAAAATTTTTTETTTSDTPQDPASGWPRGPSFLGGAIAFSTRLAPTMDQPTMYTYGGMCNVPDANSTDWQSSANYTTQMMRLAPPVTGLSRASNTAYSAGVSSAAAGGPRTPIAGFTLTQLPASTTNMSGLVTQQAGFVLLGGHTQQAFINMSTAAVWNLPEESWSYVDVAGPDSSTAGLNMRDEHGSELLDRAALDPHVGSRSGHTAVLAEDGASVIVFGGWVGDVSTPAEPQLVVLQLSQTYSSWKWAVPRAQPGGNGVYGHGAAMLPGNVMMVYGGWETSAPGGGGGTTASKRQASASGADGGVRSLRFFNVTSSSWSNSYTNPASVKAAEAGGAGGAGVGTGNSNSNSHDVPSTGNGDGTDGTSKRRKHLELGLGLGLGLGSLVAVTAALCVWAARRRERRRKRDEAVQAMAQDAQYFGHETDEMMERDDAYAWHARSKLHDGYSAGLAAGGGGGAGGASLGYETLRGLRASLDDEDDDGPYRVATAMRKPASSRASWGEGGGGSGGGGGGSYAPAEARFSAFVSPPGRIHPIMEDDEEPEDRHDDDAHGHARALFRGHRRQPSTPTSESYSDPFMTPTAATASKTTTTTTTITAATATATATKSTIRATPASPTPPSQPHMPSAASSPDDQRDHDPDVQDWVSDVDAADLLLEQYSFSRSKSRATLRRGGSTRSTALRDDESRSGSNLSESNRSVLGALGGPVDQPKPSSSCSSTASSYNTARSGFATLKAEGPALLLPSAPASPTHTHTHTHTHATDGAACSDEHESLHPEDQPPSSPSKSKPPRRTWLGSLGRVLSGSSRRVASLTGAGASHDNGGAPSASDMDMEYSTLAGDYESSAVSGAGALRGELLRRKQGRQDWEVEDQTGGDWDTEIEKAVERRLVQVMFTVPKERLRVVNGAEDPDEQTHETEAETRNTRITQVPDVKIVPATPAAELGDPVSVVSVLAPVSEPMPEPEPQSGKRISSAESKDRDRDRDRDDDDDEPHRRMSHSTDDSGKRSSGAMYVAEAVALRFERPRGRVLRMVQSIERERVQSVDSRESRESRSSVKSV